MLASCPVVGASQRADGYPRLANTLDHVGQDGKAGDDALGDGLAKYRRRRGDGEQQCEGATAGEMHDQNSMPILNFSIWRGKLPRS